MGGCTFDDRTETSSEEVRFLLEVELARRWRVSLRTLQRRRKAGKVPEHLRLGNRVLYFPERIEQYEARHLQNVEAEVRSTLPHVVDNSGAGE